MKQTFLFIVPISNKKGTDIEYKEVWFEGDNISPSKEQLLNHIPKTSKWKPVVKTIESLDELPIIGGPILTSNLQCKIILSDKTTVHSKVIVESKNNISKLCHQLSCVI